MIPKGGYKYRRKYRFSNGAHSISFHNIDFDKATGLRGTFTTRDFPAEAFPVKWAVQDLVETFIPSRPGLIKSVMAVEWKGETKNLSAVIQCEDCLNHNEEFPGLQWRHVTFNTDKSVKGVYHQSEKITVYRTLFSGHPQNLLNAEQSVEVKSEGRIKLKEETARAGAASSKIVAH